MDFCQLEITALLLHFQCSPNLSSCRIFLLNLMASIIIRQVSCIQECSFIPKGQWWETLRFLRWPFFVVLCKLKIHLGVLICDMWGLQCPYKILYCTDVYNWFPPLWFSMKRLHHTSQWSLGFLLDTVRVGAQAWFLWAKIYSHLHLVTVPNANCWPPPLVLCKPVH